MARLLDEQPGIAAIEVNVSCPNIAAGGYCFGWDAEMSADVTRAVRAGTTLPVIVKLSPGALDIVGVALAVEEAGADAISLINTLVGMAIDVKRRQPILANLTGGLSGPAIKPIARADGLSGGRGRPHPGHRDGRHHDARRCPGVLLRRAPARSKSAPPSSPNRRLLDPPDRRPGRLAGPRRASTSSTEIVGAAHAGRRPGRRRSRDVETASWRWRPDDPGSSTRCWSSSRSRVVLELTGMRRAPDASSCVSALALVPLAAVLGRATEETAIYTGPKIGALLNATLGNAAELIITIVALREGLVTVVKASIAGSIIGNILVVLGASLLLGGLKNGTQRFDAEAGRHQRHDDDAGGRRPCPSRRSSPWASRSTGPARTTSSG